MSGAYREFISAPFSLDAWYSPVFKPQLLNSGAHAAGLLERRSPPLSQQVRIF
jgi:hypothetical protein